MKNITLYSNDSSYGGISFIANHIDSNVILRSSVRKDFDKMINGIIFLKNKRSADILKKTDHLIVFGCISMKIMLKTLSDLKIPVNRFKKLTLIISDNEFLRQNEFWNQFLLKNSLEKPRSIDHIMCRSNCSLSTPPHPYPVHRNFSV